MSGVALWPLAARVARRYAEAPRHARGFARGKLLTDPATGAMLHLARTAHGFGTVADLGCGYGQMGLALLLAGLADSVAGLDLDPGRIAAARSAATGLPAQYTCTDLGTAAIPPCDTAIILDVLLQMPEAAQRGLLARMATVARRRIVIRAFDPARGWRSRLGGVMERAGCRLRRDGSGFLPLPLADLAEPMRAQGFSVRIDPCWGWTPLPNVMLIAERAPPLPRAATLC